MTDFDFSDVRIVFGNTRLLNKETVYAHLVHGSHIELYADRWRDEFKTLEWITSFIFHEHLHQVLNTVQREDGIHDMIKNEMEPHWPFFAGLDEIFGITMSKTHPHWIMSDDAIKNTRLVFDELKRQNSDSNKPNPTSDNRA